MRVPKSGPGSGRSWGKLDYLTFELQGVKSISPYWLTKGRTDEEVESVREHVANMARQACELADVAEVARLTGISEERLRQVSSSENAPPNWWPY